MVALTNLINSAEKADQTLQNGKKIVSEAGQAVENHRGKLGNAANIAQSFAGRGQDVLMALDFVPGVDVAAEVLDHAGGATIYAAGTAAKVTEDVGAGLNDALHLRVGKAFGKVGRAIGDTFGGIAGTIATAIPGAEWLDGVKFGSSLVSNKVSGDTVGHSVDTGISNRIAGLFGDKANNEKPKAAEQPKHIAAKNVPHASEKAQKSEVKHEGSNIAGNSVKKVGSVTESVSTVVGWVPGVTAATALTVGAAGIVGETTGDVLNGNFGRAAHTLVSGTVRETTRAGEDLVPGSSLVDGAVGLTTGEKISTRLGNTIADGVVGKQTHEESKAKEAAVAAAEKKAEMKDLVPDQLKQDLAKIMRQGNEGPSTEEMAQQTGIKKNVRIENGILNARIEFSADDLAKIPKENEGALKEGTGAALAQVSKPSTPTMAPAGQAIAHSH